MKQLIVLLVVLFAAVSVALVAHRDPGYLLASYGSWKIETTLSLAFVVACLGCIIFYYLARAVSTTLGMPARVRKWRGRRALHAGSTALVHGLLQLEQGQWRLAENSLTKNAAQSRTPLLNYLAAARAAQKQNAHERRDHYLALAQRSQVGAALAVELTKAELQLAHQQWTAAHTSLMQLRALSPKHGYVLKLLMQLYSERQEWQEVLALLPELRKRDVIDDQAGRELELHAHAGLIAACTQQQDVRALHAAWERVPRRLRSHDALLLPYLRGLIAEGAEAECEPLLRDSLQRHWTEPMIALYGEIAGVDPAKQLAYAEAWLKNHRHDPALLLALGRLSLRCRLWGKARAYLEASLEIAPRAEICQDLGQLLERTGEREHALEYYRRGLGLLVKTPYTPLPEAGVRPDRTEMDNRLAESATALDD